MNFIQRSIEMKGPLLLFEFIFLVGGILLVVIGLKIRKQSRSSALMSVIIGLIIALISIYLLFWTFIFGYNS
ncbi:hypothetical protein BW727_101252 [Jeotgalibaca dankookensis]|uniref:Uncharacterized protein n=1 Tax=Jeotgalibaca dankookensis TaxID=708126 RepID=A0A1S6IQ18_9LACT|nr:hypothetical protein [Jeotgalibaca dankookensis]AQS53619.1 hypothetical protein BW727_101252 [Jeotgalibaca dankookensis]